MILLQIFVFGVVAGAGMYAGVTVASRVHDQVLAWRRASRLR